MSKNRLPAVGIEEGLADLLFAMPFSTDPLQPAANCGARR